MEIQEQINNFVDELINNIIHTPDAEILQEVKNNYDDEAFLATKCRKIFDKATKKYGFNNE